MGMANICVAQQSGEVQTGPITEPRGAGEKPDGHRVKGAKAIEQRETKCSRVLIVNADALFGRGRWTLEPDAAQTLDVLVPLVVKAGNHPKRIEAYTFSGDSPKDSQIVAEKRAITVRGWLSNQGYVPRNTPVEGFVKAIPAGANSNTSDDNGQEKKEQVELIFDTCS